MSIPGGEKVAFFREISAGMKCDFRAILLLKPIKGGKRMNCHANKSIECTVQQCAHHCSDANYCSLDRILVGTHEANPTVDQCTDCKSFRKK